MRHLILPALAAAVLVGCKSDRPTLPSLPAAFATVPLPPAAEFVGQAGSEDALMFTFRSAVKADTITAYYRNLFASDSTYRVLSSTAGASGEHAYYVEYGRRPLWIRIRPEAGNEGTIVELTGAVLTTQDTLADTTRHDVQGTGPRTAPNTPPHTAPPTN